MELTKTKNTVTEPKTSYFILGAVLLFAGFYYHLSHEGLYYSDDIGYSEFAGRLINGNFDITKGGHTFIHRPTVFVPTAILYKVFGVNVITYSVWPFLCTLGCLLLTFKAAHQKSLNPAFAVVFLGLTFYFIYFINFLYPDNIVAFFTLVSATIYHKTLNGEKGNLLYNALIFTCSLFLAGLAKETAVVCLPFFGFLAIKDLVEKGNNVRFWAYAVVIGMLLLLAYFGWYYVKTGDPFNRVSEMETANLSYDNYVTSPSKNYMGRLLWGPFEALLGTGTFIIVVFMVGGGSMLQVQERKSKSYWSLLFFIAYLTLCFSSTSLKVYNPIKLDARMYNLVIPPLAIAASYGFHLKLSNTRYTLAYTLAFAVIAFYLANKVGIVYGILALYFAAHTAWLYFRQPENKRLAIAALTAIALCLSIRPLYFMFKPKTLYYQEHEALFSELKEIATQENQTKVILPGYLHKSIGYYLHYKEIKGLYFYSYTSSITSAAASETFLLLNRKLNTNPSFTEDSPPQGLLKAARPEFLIWKKGPLELYKL